nr:MAG TPA: protein of unknown function (DUF4113) [Caudoviricetes sp.]
MAIYKGNKRIDTINRRWGGGIADLQGGDAGVHAQV